MDSREYVLSHSCLQLPLLHKAVIIESEQYSIKYWSAFTATLVHLKTSRNEFFALCFSLIAVVHFFNFSDPTGTRYRIGLLLKVYSV